jgi:hypothetical protein
MGCMEYAALALALASAALSAGAAFLSLRACAANRAELERLRMKMLDMSVELSMVGTQTRMLARPEDDRTEVAQPRGGRR